MGRDFVVYFLASCRRISTLHTWQSWRAIHWSTALSIFRYIVYVYIAICLSARAPFSPLAFLYIANYSMYALFRGQIQFEICIFVHGIYIYVHIY